MIEVFDVMAIQGTSNVKAMANGVSMATIPTMAGMVIALSGILFEKRLEVSIKYQTEKLYLDISKVL
jgi:biopolymer transport protein ExbB